MDRKELVKTIKDHGIVGAGGAGFPTYSKLDQRTDTIILNCAECEPLLKVHRLLLQEFTYEILHTLELIAQTVEARNIIVAVKASYTKTVEAVMSWKNAFPYIQIKLLPEVYPMGDEIILTYEALGKVIPPGRIPIDVGVTVFNVETILNIYKAITDQEPVYTKYLTIAGEVKTPITVKVPIGVSVQETVDLAGTVLVDEPAYIMGGPMTGKVVNSYDTITKTTNAILVLPKEHSLIRRIQSDISVDINRAMSVCCQCEMCTDLCPRHQIGHPIMPHMFMRALTNGITADLKPYLNTMFCSACGVCEMYACPQGLSPRRLIAEYKNRLKQKGVRIPSEVPLKEVEPWREYRQVPMERLVTRLGLKDYDVDAPLKTEELLPKQVRISLHQNIGAEAKVIVKVKDMVEQGDVIAVAEEGKLSVPIHASISGVIQEINNSFIMIKSIERLHR